MNVLNTPLTRSTQKLALQQLSNLQQTIVHMDAPTAVYKAVQAFAQIVKGGYQPKSVDYANLLSILERNTSWRIASAVYAAVPCKVGKVSF